MCQYGISGFGTAKAYSEALGRRDDRKALERLFDPANYLGAAPEMTRRLLQKREAPVTRLADAAYAPGAERE